MDFKRILEDSKCDCTKDLKENTKKLFTRKIKKSELNTNDFNSYWEVGKRTEDNSCQSICALKGVSIDEYTQENKQKIESQYQVSFGISYGKRKDIYYIVFSFKKDAGVLKHSPSSNNVRHHSFFKSDNFTNEYINVISTNLVT